jgi:hypothetical protein
MKSLLPLLSLALLAPALSAKEPVAINTPPDFWNFYFAPGVAFCEIRDDNANYVGAEVGASFNNKLDFGLLYQTTINDLDLNNPASADPAEGDVWDIGGVVEWHLDPCLMVECSLQLFVGKGRIDVGNRSNGDAAETDFLLIEPSVNVAGNLTDHLVLGFGAGYRFANGSDSPLIRDEDLDNAIGRIYLRFDEF